MATLRKRNQALRVLGRFLLALILIGAGIGHFARTSAFSAQVPPWMPAPTAVIYVSGVIEIVLGLSLLLLRNQRILVGWIIAGFFVVIFPGNISQFLTQQDAFGLDTDLERFIRLLFQPPLVWLALWSSGVTKSRNTAELQLRRRWP